MEPPINESEDFFFERSRSYICTNFSVSHKHFTKEHDNRQFSPDHLTNNETFTDRSTKIVATSLKK